jgi:hypothetical protein
VASSGQTGFTNNGGSLTVANGGNLTVTNNNYTQSGAGASLEADGTVKAIAAIINGGTVTGNGTINAAVTNNGGNVMPTYGGAPSTLNVVGSYTQGSGGTLTIDLAGATNPGGFSVLAVNGNATLDGTVDFTTLGGFTPVAGDDFTFLTWTGSESGNFATVDFTNWVCPTGDTCTDVLASNSLSLDITGPVTTTPEPSVFLLLAMGIVMVTVLRKYRNKVSTEGE